MPDFGPFVDQKEQEESMEKSDIQIWDLGTYTDEMVLDDFACKIVVLGARHWEQEKSKEVLKKLMTQGKCICVCSLYTKKEVQELASCLGREVLCIPAWSNPYYPGWKIRKAILQHIKEYV